MFRPVFRRTALAFLIFCIFCFQNVFSETGGLKDRPVSVMLVCAPSSQADKPRFYKSTSLFFKRLKNKRAQENGTAFLVGYGSFSSETPAEQLNLAVQNGYDLYIFPKNVTENLPSHSNKTLPWISFVSEKKNEVSKTQSVKPKSKTSSSRKSGKKKSKRKTITKTSVLPETSNATASAQTKTQKATTSSEPEPKTSEPKREDSSLTKTPASSTDSKTETKKPSRAKSKSAKKGSSKKKNVKTEKNKAPEKTEKTKDSSPETKNQPQENAGSKKNESASFELNFDSLKFWFSTLTDSVEFPWESDKILFLAGDKTAEEWNSILSGKTEDATLIRLLNSPQDLKFNEGIYYTGCASPGIPNGVSVLNFFFRGNRLIRLKQESFSLNSDGSGKSWELE